MFLCCVRCSTSISLASDSSSLGLSFSVCISFTAAICPVSAWLAFHTIAKDPEPIGAGSRAHLPTTRPMQLGPRTEAREVEGCSLGFPVTVRG
jgi:hypothetical protein